MRCPRAGARGQQDRDVRSCPSTAALQQGDVEVKRVGTPSGKMSGGYKTVGEPFADRRKRLARTDPRS